MVDIKILDKNFEESDKLQIPINLDSEIINIPSVHQVIKAILAGKRQGTASTKTKGLVRGGGIKPFKQKGTGRARQGSIRSPLLVGGGTIFGPSPRDYTQKINKKMMLKAIQSVLADKFQAGKLIIVDKIESNGKTKSIHKILTERDILPALIIVSSENIAAIRATRNLKNASVLPVEAFSVYEAVKYENLIIEKKALDKLLARLG